MDMKRCNPHKEYVRVLAEHQTDGTIQPLSFRRDNGDTVRLDRVLDVRPATSLKAGGQGIRYTCRAEGREVFLFHDRDWWFIEKDA